MAATLLRDLAGHLQDLDFGVFLGRGKGHELYDSYLFNGVYLFS